MVAINKGMVEELHFIATDNTPRGASFCQVVKMSKLVQLREEATGGNQKWNGAAPSFIKILIKIKVDVKVDGGVKDWDEIPAVKKRIDPAA